MRRQQRWLPVLGINGEVCIVFLCARDYAFKDFLHGDTTEVLAYTIFSYML